MLPKNKSSFWLVLSIIIAFSFLIRVYNINEVPPGVYPDEAVNGEDAIRALETGHFQWFYPANQGREGLFMNLVALCFKLFGVSVFSLKLPAIIFGTLTIGGIFLLGKELWNERVGIIAAFLSAVSFWPLIINRISFRANMLPFILVFSFYFAFRGLRTKKIWDFIIGGFIFGIGMHTYIAWRISPLILIVLLFALIFSQKNFLQTYWKGLLAFLLFSFISAAPMFWTFYSHPEYFESRSDSISVFSPSVNGGHPIKTLVNSFKMSLIKYNFWGDQNWRHGFPPYPILDPLTGLAFLAGFLFATYQSFRFFHKLISRQKISLEAIPHLFLISWFFIMLAPEFLTAEGLPHALRAIGTAPAVFLLAAFSLEKMIAQNKIRSEAKRKTIFIVAVFFLVFIGTFNPIKYHFVWAKKVETARAFDRVVLDVSRYLSTVSENKKIYIVTGNMQRVPINVFNHEQKNFEFIYPGETEKIPFSKEKMEIIFTDNDPEGIEKLQKRFPRSFFAEVKNEFGISFYLLKIN